MTNFSFDDIANLSEDLRHRTISPLEITALLARIDTSDAARHGLRPLRDLGICRLGFSQRQSAVTTT
jgi:hypothetical protein